MAHHFVPSECTSRLHEVVENNQENEKRLYVNTLSSFKIEGATGAAKFEKRNFLAKSFNKNWSRNRVS